MDLMRLSDLKKLGLRLNPRWGPFLRPGEKIFINAPRKTGKTNFCIQMAVSLTCGISFLGYASVQSKVLYIDLEIGGQTFNVRLDEICASLDRPEINERELQENLLYVRSFKTLPEIIKVTPDVNSGHETFFHAAICLA